MALKKSKGSEPKDSKPETDSPKKEGNAKLESLKQKLEGKYGKGTVSRPGRDLGIRRVPSGILGLDVLLGGGVPVGKIMEFYGPESSGKTTTALAIGGSFQRKESSVAFIDVEQALDLKYAKEVGCDLLDEDKALLTQPDSAEDALDSLEMIISEGGAGLSIVDSVAALTPKAELEGEMGKAHVGLQARLMSQACRKITGAANKNEQSIIFTNQLRMKIGVMYGNPETTSGGNALKFYASVRLDIRKIGTIKDDNDKPIGSEIKVKVVKNKTAGTAFHEDTFRIYWGTGYDKIGDLIKLASEYGVIKKGGAWFNITTSKGEEKFQGMDKLMVALMADKELCRSVLEKTVDKLIAAGKLPESYADEVEFVFEGFNFGKAKLAVASEQAANDPELAS